MWWWSVAAFAWSPSPSAWYGFQGIEQLVPLDLDGDGSDDVVSCLWLGGYGVDVTFGPWAAPTTTAYDDLSFTSFPQSCAMLGDLDGDGADELAAAGYDWTLARTSGIEVLAWDGVALGPTSTWDAGATGWVGVTAVGDHDGDGLRDALVSTVDLGLHLSTPAGIGAAAVWTRATTWGEQFQVAGGDLDGDGDDELVVSSRQLGLERYDGGPGGLAASPTAWGPVHGGTVEGAAIGDWDGDGDRELVTYEHRFPYDWLDLYDAGGTVPSTSTRADLLLTSFPSQILWAGDVNGDGADDLGLSQGDAFAICLGGTPAFATCFSYEGGLASAQGADLDGNGLDDLLAVSGSAYALLSWPDVDGDGFFLGGAANPDCDDADPTVHPDAVEVPADGIDQDCDGLEACYVDGDDDGWLPFALPTVETTDTACVGPGHGANPRRAGDCDDGDPARHPNAAEVPGDEIDEDCDGDEVCFVDADRDGARTTATTTPGGSFCRSMDGVAPQWAPIDCDDATTERSPLRDEEPADGVDQDCDGTDACWADADLDGIAASTWTGNDLDCTDPGELAVAPAVPDCDDADPATFPGAPEVVGDGTDQDCDGVEPCPVDGDGDGVVGADTVDVVAWLGDCAAQGELDDTAPAGDCDDADPVRSPAAAEQVDDGVDQDCDGGDRCPADADGDGFSDGFTASADLDCRDAGEARGTAPAGDCDDADADAFPGATEVCDGVDQDCDGRVDEGVTDTFWPDADGDGVAGHAGAREACDAPPGYLAAGDAWDCDDADPTRAPGLDDRPSDGVDQDCDGADAAGDPDPAPGTDPTTDPDPRSASGCGCASGPGATAVAPLLAVVAAIARRRRTRAARRSPR